MLEKKHLVMLDLLATNNWERPVYFSTTVNSADFIGLSEYFQLDGLAYRVVPVKTSNKNSQGFLEIPGYLNKEVMYNNLMKEFQFRNFDDPGIFYDENYYRFTANARDKFGKLASAYLAEGNKARAKELVDYCFKVLPLETVPHDYYTPQFINIYAGLGEDQKAKQLLDDMAKNSSEALNYYLSKGALFEMEVQTNMLMMQQLVFAAQDLGMTERAAELERQYTQYLQSMRR